MPKIKTEKNNISFNGIMFPGNPNTFLGYALTGVGDVNGDGQLDMILGAPIENNVIGSAYVIFGTNNLPSIIDVFSLNGQNGFKISGIKPNDGLGFSVSGAGDINGDGLSDIVVGAPGGALVDPGFAGNAYVIYGKNNSFPAELNVSTLNGQNGFAIDNDYVHIKGMGYSVSGISDLNADGVDDIAISAPKYSDLFHSESAVYVVFGNKNGFPAQFKVRELDGNNGFLVHTPMNDTTLFGASVSGAGDINGDGIPELMIGAPYLNGRVYVIYGQKGSYPPSLNIDDPYGQTGFKLTTFQPDNNNGYNTGLGMSVSSGDINGDDLSDMIMGAPYDNHSDSVEVMGATYVVFGNNQFQASFNVSMLNGENGFRVNGFASIALGDSVSFVGDVNGDGLSDILIGSSQVAAYLVYGPFDKFPASLNVTDLNGKNGFQILNPEGSKTVVSGAGDVNGDGVNDMLFGYPSYNSVGHPAGAYTLFGRSSETSPFPANVTLPAVPALPPFSLDHSLSTSHHRKLLSLGSMNDINIKQRETVNLKTNSRTTAGIAKGAIGIFSVASSIKLLPEMSEHVLKADPISSFDLNIPMAFGMGSLALMIVFSLLFYVLFRCQNQGHAKNEQPAQEKLFSL